MNLQIASHVSVVETPGGTVLLNQRTGRYWQLNDTGALVLRLLRDGGGVDDAVTELTAAHPESADRIAEDVAALVRSLREAQVIAP